MQDLRLALRALRSAPAVWTAAILSLALGIGANTAIFSILDSLLLRSLPVREPERLVLLGTSQGQRSYTNPIWEQIRDRPQLFDGALAWQSTRFDLAPRGQSEFVDGIWASGRLFDVLGVPAMLGRTFTEADDRRGGGSDGPVAVISYTFWQRRFSGAADVIGRTISVERVPFTIVGVTPPDFFGPDVGRRFEIAIPIGTEPLIRGRESALDQRSWWWLRVMARLRPDQTLDSAAKALQGVQPQIREATIPPLWRPETLYRYLGDPFTLSSAVTGDSSLRRRYSRPVLTLMVVVGLVLLIACANVANLLLARATARRHELSVRLALGASRLRLAREMLTESVLFAGAGAALGLLFAQWGSRLLVNQLSTQVSTAFLDLSLDWRVLGFTATAALATAVLFGTAPALRAASAQPIDALREHGRGTVGDGRGRLASALVVAQVTLSVVLVVAAGLFLRTFSSLVNLDLGFNRVGVLLVSADAQRKQLEPAERPAVYERMRQAVLAVPGVARAALSVVTPVSGSNWSYLVEVPGAPPLSEDDRSVFVNMLSPDWFATYGTPILAGRDFTLGDGQGAARVAIVNEAFARRFMAGANPIGRTLRLGGGRDEKPLMEVVGLTRDAVYRSLREPVPPTVYVPLAQAPTNPPASIEISLRSAAGSPAGLTRSVVAALADAHPDLAISVRVLEEQVSASLTQERLVAILSGFFGGLALLLAGLGLYSVMSYAVARRRTEIGIRLALGAAPAGVVRMVLKRVAILVGTGVVIGGALSIWTSRFVQALLFGVEARDPATFAGAIGVLIVVGIAAGWLPARRAAQLDPAQVLREG